MPSMPHLHRLGLSWIFLTCLFFAATAHAINIVSSTFVFEGTWGESWYTTADRQSHGQSGQFHHTSSDGAPMSQVERSAPFGFVSSRVDLQPFNFRFRADASPSWLNYDWGFGSTDGTYIGATAQSTTVFRPESPDLTASLFGYANFNYYRSEQDLTFTLTDLTGGVVLWQDDFSSLGFFVEQTRVFTVDPTHEYAWTVSGQIHAFDSKEADLRLSLELVDESSTTLPVPDTGSSLLLLLATAPIWFWSRKMFQRGLLTGR